MNTTRNRIECGRLVNRIEAALQAEDTVRLVAMMTELKTCSIYSGNPVHMQWKELMPKVLQHLLRYEPVGVVASLQSGFTVSSSDIFNALGSMGDDVDIEQVLALSEALGEIPSRHGEAALFKALAASSGGRVTQWLVDWIESGLPKDLPNASTKTEIPTSMQRARAKNHAVDILAHRDGPLAHRSTEKYLFAPPQSVEQWWLIDALGDAKTDTNHALRRRAVDYYPDPSRLRLRILKVLRIYDPDTAVELVVKDIHHLETALDREVYLDWLWDAKEETDENTARGQADNAPMDSCHRQETAIRTINLRGWSILSRGYLGTLFTLRFPGVRPLDGVRRLDYAAFRLACVFKRIRPTAFSWPLYVTAQFVIALLYRLLLNYTIGTPGKPANGPDLLVVVFWLLTTVAVHQMVAPRGQFRPSHEAGHVLPSHKRRPVETQLLRWRMWTICRGSRDSAIGSPINAQASSANCHIILIRSSGDIIIRSVSFPCS